MFLIVAVLIGWVVIRYRSRSDTLPRGRDKSHAEEVYALGLVLIAGALVFLTFNTMSDLEASPADGPPPLEVDVTAARWNWRFTYPELGVTQVGSGTEIPTLVVPAETPVRFDITSLDVIHSFFIPMLRFKRDAFPGRVNTVELVFQDVGFHRGGGECAEYCGLRHSYMDFDVEVMQPDDFDAWADEQAEATQG